MNTILLAPRRAPSKGRVLAIEPDSARAEKLRDLVGDQVGAACSVVKHVQDAIRSIETGMPDVVLTSMLLAPQDAEELTACVRRLPGAAHVQIITLPYFIDSDETTTQRRPTVLRFIRRRAAVERPACAPAVVAAQIEAYLEQAFERRNAPPAAPRFSPPASMRSTPAVKDGTGRKPATVHQLGRPYANDRRRAKRRAAAELPWLWTIQLASGMDLKVIDVSSSGALLETATKIPAGTAIDLRVMGQDVNVCVPARMTRTEVAAVDGRGVRYHVAAAFVSGLEMRGLEAPPPPAAVTPAAIAELLTRVLRDSDRHTGATLRTNFEHGLRRLLPVQDVSIRWKPLIPAEGLESIYFKVPTATAWQPILQAIFEPNAQPTADAFKLLKTAANLAAVLLDAAPLDEATVN